MLGVSRRDRYARRADKVWRSRWLCNMQQSKHPKPLDNLAWMADSYGTSTVGPSVTSNSKQPKYVHIMVISMKYFSIKDC